MANRLKGEVEVKLFGTKHTLRPDIQSICEIEDATQGEYSLPKMFRQVMQEQYPLRMMALVIYGCLKANGVRAPMAPDHKGPAEPYSLDSIMREVRKIGVPDLCVQIGTVVCAMTCKEEAEEEKKGPAESVEVTASTG